MQRNEIVLKPDYYMEKSGERNPVKIKSGKFKKQMVEAMADNQEIIKGLEDKTFAFENIVEVFDAYNKSSKK